MFEYLHPDQQVQLVRQHHEELRSFARSARPVGARRRRRYGEPSSLRLRLRPRHRIRRVASAVGLTRTAGFGALRPH